MISQSGTRLHSVNYPVIDSDRHDALGSQVMASIHLIAAIASKEAPATDVYKHWQPGLRPSFRRPDVEGQALS